MANNAIVYSFVDEETLQTYEELKKEHNLDEYRERILAYTAHTLSKHVRFTDVEYNEEDIGSTFRENELIGIVSALHALDHDLENYKEMSRLDHLKAAITGGR